LRIRLSPDFPAALRGLDPKHLFEALAGHQACGRFVHLDLTVGDEQGSAETGKLAEVMEGDENRLTGVSSDFQNR